MYYTYENGAFLQVENRRTFRFVFEIPRCSFSIEKPYSNEQGILKHRFFFDNVEQISVILKDQKFVSDELTLNKGLVAEVQISGQDMDSAWQKAEIQLHVVLSLAVFQSNSMVGDAHLLFGHETTSEAKTTEFIQIEYFSHDLAERKRALNSDVLKALAGALSSVSTGVAVGLRWYRKGLTEDDAFDQFLNYWGGLEYLNKGLANLLGAKPMMRECKKCKTKYAVPSAGGIHALFTKYSPGQEQDFIQCRDMSVDLRHGDISLSEAITKIHPLTNTCRSMLRIGLSLLLGLPVEDQQEELEPIYNVHLPRIEHRGVYEISPNSFIDGPPLLVNTQLVGMGNTDDKRTISLRSNIQPALSIPYTYSSRYVCEAGIEIQATNVG